MRTLSSWLFATLLVAAPAAAQDPADLPQREALRQRIEQNFLARVKEDLALTDDQATKLQEVSRRTVEKRRTLEQENRRLNQALAAQLRPGVAADPRVVKRVLDSLVDLRLAGAQIYRDEHRELATFLTDVQRAQYHMLRERLLNRMEDLRAQRQGPPPGARRR